MSHRPLTNTSSLKITAAYCTLNSGIHLADFMFLLYTAQSSVLGFFSSHRNWDPPPPQPQESVSPPSFGSGGGGAHSPACEGVTLRS
jgi:hypothetical protein